MRWIKLTENIGDMSYHQPSELPVAGMPFRKMPVEPIHRAGPLLLLRQCPTTLATLAPCGLRTPCRLTVLSHAIKTWAAVRPGRIWVA